jgi:hypothetical protein
MAAWAGLVPALLAALYAGWCGNLLGGVTAAGSATALGVLLLALAAFAGSFRDPLRLGRVWGWAPLGLWIAVAASAWLSPVPRAGLEAVLLLPAYFCLPGAFARCWSGEAARRLGARALAAAVALLAAWSLATDHLQGMVAGVIAPLGHRPLLATWLATLLPMAVLPLRERTAWRWLGAAAGILAIAAVVAGRSQPVAADVPGRSLAGGAALACEALLAAWWLARRGGQASRRAIGGLALAGFALAAFQLQRVLLIVARQDPSALARAVYVRAGWEGWRERPWLGWGPGSVPWTAAWFLTPRPGINPWGEAVGELHSLPVHLAYETGALGLLGALAAGGAFTRRRFLERRAASDPGWLAAGCVGLAGAGIAALGTAALAVPALPLALAAAAGAALAGGAPGAADAPGAAHPPEGPAGAAGPPGALSPPAGGPPPPGAGPPPIRAAAPAPTRLSGPACVYGVIAVLGLLAPEMARWHYDRAVAAGQAGRPHAADTELAAAIRLDQAFPLYRMRLALLRGGEAVDHEAAAPLALSAARDGQGIGLLWLAAGILGRADGEVWAPAAFEQGCALDPLSPYPPFYLMASAPGAAAAPRLGARALMAEPRLMAATFWEGREPLFRRALEEVRAWPGIDAGWKLALLRAAPVPAARRGPTVRLALAIDDASYTQATSLHLFRRLPWPTLWPLVALRQDLVTLFRMPPATSLLASGRGARGGGFEKSCCLRTVPRAITRARPCPKADLRSFRGHLLPTT